MNSSQVGRLLDGEHRDDIALLGKVEQSFARASRFEPELAGLTRQLLGALERDIDRHFRFEEESLFPRMADAGDDEMAGLLAEEHQSIREVAAELLPLARQGLDGTLAAEGWSRLRLCALELVERQVAHIQKETMALLPLLDDVLDDQTDRNLAFAYASG